MITRQQADQIATVWLDSREIAAIDFESGLPRHDERRVQKWCAVAGNAPLIVDRTDGKLNITGTARPLEHYLMELRRGNRTKA